MLIDFKDIDGLELPDDRKLKLVDGVLLLERQNDEMLSSGELGFVVYQLYFSENEDIVYSDSLDLPIQAFNFTSEIEKSLTADGESLTPEMEEFLTAIYKELSQKRERKRKKRQPKREKRDHESIQNIEEPEQIEESISPQESVSKPSIKKKKFPKQKKNKEKEPRNISYGFGRKGKISLIALAVFFLFIFLVFGAVKWLPNLFADRAPSYEELMKDEKYYDAARSYPEQKEDIEQRLYDKALDKKSTETEQDLESYQKKFPTKYGEFDLAILNKNYDKALSLYKEKPKTFRDSKDRMTLVGYCYLKKDRPKEAKEISVEIQSVELEKYVYKYEQLIAQIEEYDKQLEELKKDPVKNRDKIEETLNELFDSKEELVNL